MTAAELRCIFRVSLGAKKKFGEHCFPIPMEGLSILCLCWNYNLHYLYVWLLHNCLSLMCVLHFLLFHWQYVPQWLAGGWLIYSWLLLRDWTDYIYDWADIFSFRTLQDFRKPLLSTYWCHLSQMVNRLSVNKVVGMCLCLLFGRSELISASQ